MSETLWYQDGLRFECTRCGNCCRGAGYVWVDDDEMAQLAGHLQLDRSRFEALYTRKVGRGNALRDGANDDCVFFREDVGCTVYPARPRQCRAWPFWSSNVESSAAWARTRERCPGAGEGALISAEEITRLLRVTRL
jgi:Fe-S-cluster containining protein